MGLGKLKRRNYSRKVGRGDYRDLEKELRSTLPSMKKEEEEEEGGGVGEGQGGEGERKGGVKRLA